MKTKIIKICPICKKNFELMPHEEKQILTCSRSCGGKLKIGKMSKEEKESQLIKRMKGVIGKKTGLYKNCENCNKEFYCYPYEIKKKRACSIRCGRLIKKNIAWNKGLKGYRKGISRIKKNSGFIPWNKGLNKYNNEKINKLSEKLKITQIKKYIEHPEIKDKIRNKLIGRKLSKEHIRNSLRRKEKSSLEIKFESIINKFNLPYKFVGNGKLFIEKKCPDFVNLKEKIAIEVYCRKHKNLFRNGGLEGWKEERIEIFNKNGWRIIFFDETKVNEKSINDILGDKKLAVHH